MPGNSEIFGRDKICAVIAAPSAKGMARQLRRALRRTSTIELRLDWLASDDEIRKFLRGLARRKVPATMIATCRRRPGGGLYGGTIADELFVLLQALRSGCSWFDLEVETSSRCPRELLTVLLGEGRCLSSAHFFRRMPANVSKAARAASRPQPDAIKLAAQCDSLREARSLFRVARGGRSAVIVPMGDVASAARILALRQGSALAYAPVEDATAPGQVNWEELKDLYRADRLTKATRVYGVIGDPIGHSLSPRMHNAGFQARRIDAVYVPFLVRDIEDFLDSIRPLGIAGFSITLPHKQKIMDYLDQCDPLAAEIGAVNTVVVRGGKLRGSNTDYIGVLRTLEGRIPLRGSRILIVGAGGAARSVAFALGKAGANVCVAARRPDRAKALARAMGGVALGRSALKKEFFDVVVNATPVGMRPMERQSPLKATELNCHLLFDTIYRPRTTRLMQLAAQKGIETISGLEMFLAQGAAQWELWTGQRAPLEAMRRAVVKALDREGAAVRAGQRNVGRNKSK